MLTNVMDKVIVTIINVNVLKDIKELNVKLNLLLKIVII